MYSMVTNGQCCTVYLKVVKTVNLKSYHHIQKMVSSEGVGVFTCIMVSISQYMCISNHHAVYLTFTYVTCQKYIDKAGENKHMYR